MLKKLNVKFRMPTSFVIILMVMGFIAFLSWFTNGTFAAELEDGSVVEANETAKIGLFAAWFMYPIKGFLDASDLIMFLFAIGAFIGIMMETEAMEAGMVSLIKKLKGKEIWAIIPLMMLFSFGGTTYGMAEETIAFFPIIVPLFILAGFDPLVGFMVLALGAGTGVAASTVNPFAIGAAAAAAEETGVGVGDGMVVRWLGWVFFTSLAIGFVMWYATRTKGNKSKSGLESDNLASVTSDAKSKFSIENAPQFTTRRKIGLITFGLVMITMVLAVIPWETFGASAPGEWDGPITMFYTMGDWLNEHLFFIFGGTMNFEDDGTAFYIGGMYFMQLAMLFFFGFILLAFIFKSGEKGAIESFMVGAKDMFSVGMIIAVSRGLSLLLGDTGFTLRILNSASENMKDMSKVGFIIVTFILMILLSFLIPSTSGLAGATFGVLGPLANEIGGADGIALTALAITAFGLASGIVNLFTPTSGIVMGGLEVAKMPYGSYVKTIAPYVGAFAVSAVVFLSIAAAMI